MKKKISLGAILSALLMMPVYTYSSRPPSLKKEVSMVEAAICCCFAGCLVMSSLPAQSDTLSTAAPAPNGSPSLLQNNQGFFGKSQHRLKMMMEKEKREIERAQHRNSERKKNQ